MPAGDAESLAAAIAELVEQDDLRRALGRAARNLVEKQCSWESYGDRVLACIRTGSAEPALARRALRPREGEGSGRSRPGRSWPALSSAGTADQWVDMDWPRSSVGGDDGWASAVG